MLTVFEDIFWQVLTVFDRFGQFLNLHKIIMKHAPIKKVIIGNKNCSFHYIKITRNLIFKPEFF